LSAQEEPVVLDQNVLCNFMDLDLPLVKELGATTDDYRRNII
jgi:hypothetical protein